MLDSPNYGSLDRFAFEARRVEKPWGWELIWAHTDAYVGKVLFVREGESLSLQFHREKDESWYVQSGRARLELGEDALALLPEQGDHEQSTFPQLAQERRLHAHRHEGVWLTVNTPKDLRRAAEFIEERPDWRPQKQRA